jgi:hypothetical protein
MAGSTHYRLVSLKSTYVVEVVVFDGVSGVDGYPPATGYC